MSDYKEIRFWDDQKNFYRLFHEGRNFYVKKDDVVLLEGRTLRMKCIDEYPVRPFITQNKLFLFHYESGMEIHHLDGSGKTFLDVRAAQAMDFANDRLIMKKIENVVEIDIVNEIVLQKVHSSESLKILDLDGYLLFYRYKRGKTYLYNIYTKEFVQLPNFEKEFNILTSGVKEGNKLAVYYCAARKLQYESGVYIYDLEKKSGFIKYALSDCSCGLSRYLSLTHFSYHGSYEPGGQIEYDCGNYPEYLKFLIEKLGIFAFMYYTDARRLGEIEDSCKREEIERLYSGLIEKMKAYPGTNREYESMLGEMEKCEKRFKELLGG